MGNDKLYHQVGKNNNRLKIGIYIRKSDGKIITAYPTVSEYKGL